MPNPTRSDAHVDRLLTNFSIAFVRSNPSMSLARRVFPTLPVARQSDKYWVYPRGEWLRTIAEKRAPGTESVGGGWTYSTEPYFAEVYAVHKDIDDQTRANVDEVINLEADSTEWVTQQLLLRQDVDWNNKFFQPGVWTRELTGVAAGPAANQFLQFNETGSDPIGVLRAQIIAQQELTGLSPNRLVVGARAWTTLADHPALLERVKYSERGMVTTDLLASLLELPAGSIIVAATVTNTAQEGEPDTFQFLAGKHMLLAYAADRPGPRTASAGYTFGWTGLLGGAAGAARIKNFRMEAIESDRIEGETAYDMKVTAPDLGVFLANVVA